MFFQILVVVSSLLFFPISFSEELTLYQAKWCVQQSTTLEKDGELLKDQAHIILDLVQNAPKNLDSDLFDQVINEMFLSYHKHFDQYSYNVKTFRDNCFRSSIHQEVLSQACSQQLDNKWCKIFQIKYNHVL